MPSSLSIQTMACSSFILIYASFSASCLVRLCFYSSDSAIMLCILSTLTLTSSCSAPTYSLVLDSRLFFSSFSSSSCSLRYSISLAMSSLPPASSSVSSRILPIFEKKSEGWITGLRLATLSLRYTDDLKRAVQTNKQISEHWAKERLGKYLKVCSVETVRSFLCPSPSKLCLSTRQRQLS